ncbi:MAG: ABC transporter permease [Treponema sp.]|nr:ABC transporter permease [Treponema sp.]
MKEIRKVQSGPPEAGGFKTVDFSHLQSFSFGIILIPVLSVLFLILLIFIFNDNPAQALYFFFIGPFRNIFSFGNMLNASVPLIFGALGVIVAMKAGCLNLGGEGQIYFGAFTTTITALALSQFGITGAIIAAIAGALSAGIIAAFSGFCRAMWNTSEIITTFLVSCALIPVVNYMVTVPFADHESSLLSTQKIAENMRLLLILKPSSLSIGFIIAFIFVFIVHFFLFRTKPGYELRMTGNNEIFARYAGINTKLHTVLAMMLSGCLYGLAGSFAVLGTHHAVIKEFSAGLGWNGLAVALLCGFFPPAVIPSALFFAWLAAGSRISMQNTGLTMEIASIVQAAIFFLAASLLIRKIFSGKRKSL